MGVHMTKTKIISLRVNFVSFHALTLTATLHFPTNIEPNTMMSVDSSFFLAPVGVELLYPAMKCTSTYVTDAVCVKQNVPCQSLDVLLSCKPKMSPAI
mmetsp:Transcript_44459/g.79748  ORF Transcript_44459/g.79748 Transcript_44459/m.79748 type:complete len:98 (-) Transcript_44459:65-358(-)